MALSSSRRGNAISGMIVGILVIISGVAIGAHHFSLAYHDQKILSEGVRTVGTVTEIQFDVRTNSKNHSEKTMTVSYVDQNGEDHKVDSTERYNMRREGPTETVEEQLLNQEKIVFYDPVNTSDAVVEGWEEPYSDSYVNGGFLIFIGALATGIATYSQRKSRRTCNTTSAMSTKEHSQ